MLQVEEGYVDVDDQKIAYTRSSAPARVALFHGIPTSRYLWRKVVNVLSAANRGWVAFDLVGYGASSKPAAVDLGVKAQARFMSQALKQLGWAGGAVVGHDIGGGVAQLLALDKMVKVNRLVLVDSIAYDSFPEPGIARLKEPVWDSILGAQDFDLKKGLMKGLIRGMVNQEAVTAELVAEYERPFFGVAGRLAYLRAARALNSDDLVSQTAEIERLQIPVLLVWGAEDRFQPIHYGEKLARIIPNAELKVIAGAGHFLPEDAPDTLGELISDFVSRT